MTRTVSGMLRSLVGGMLLTATLGGCSEQESRDFVMPPVQSPSYTETGDFDAIQRRGRLRLLVARDHATIDGLPHEQSPIYHQIRSATHFAGRFGLRPVIVLIEHPGDLITALEDGRGDLVVNNIVIHSEYAERVDFTVALDRTRQMLVARSEDPMSEPADMAGRTITVPPDSRALRTARALQQEWPELRVETLPGLSPQRRVDFLVDERIELTILESNFLDNILEKHPGVRGVFPVSGESGAGWAIRQDSPQLRTVLNRFIARHQLADLRHAQRTHDLDGVIDTGTLRMVTRNSGDSYFLARGKLLGFEYELAQELAQRLNVNLEVVVGDDDADILRKLETGRADFAAAFLAKDDNRANAAIQWSRPYHEAPMQIVAPMEEPAFDSVDDLNGRTVHVHEDNRYRDALEALRDEHGVDLQLRATAAGESVETSISRVASGDYGLTIADAHMVRNAMVGQENVHPVLDIDDPVEHRWAVRADNPGMLEAVNAFLGSIYRSTLYNVLYAKYFRDTEHIRGFHAHRLDRDSTRALSPWDDIVRNYANEYGLDWRLALAQMYQESGFNPRVRSWMGAVGLMQVMPRTAGQLKVDGDLLDPATNIEAGLRYMAWLNDRFEDDLHVHDRTWFTLAAYNAGIGHVRDARRLAAQLGLDRDRWFDNVEVAMLKLSERQYFQHARFGYVRGREPVNYVREIRERYQAYLMWTDDCWPHCGRDPHPRTAVGALQGGDR